MQRRHFLFRNNYSSEILRYAVFVNEYECSCGADYVGAVWFAGAVVDGFDFRISFEDGIYGVAVNSDVIRVDVIRRSS